MKKLLLFLFFVVLFSSTAMAQKDTVVVDGYYELLTSNPDLASGTLNRAIADVKANGDINNTVFELKPYDVYVLTSSIFMEPGENLDIYAPKPLREGDADSETVQNSAPPQIVWTEEEIDRNYIIQTFGDVKMQNIWIRYADIQGNQVGSTIAFEDTVAAGGEPDKEYGRFDGVIFEYFPLAAGGAGESGGAITVKADNFVGIFKNSYFRNGTDSHFQYYGRAVSFPYQSTEFHYDSLHFENTTFSNLSRIVMMEGNEYASNIHLNHVTLINSIEWAIQTGWWEDLSITNSIFVNTNMLGPRILDFCEDGQDYDDYMDGNCEGTPGGGLVQDIVPADSMAFVDFTDQDRQIYIDNNVYYHEDYMLDWYTECNWCEERIQSRESDELHLPPPAIGENAYAFYDSLDADDNKVFPLMNIGEFYDEPADFAVPPTNKEDMLDFVMFKWSTNADVDWSYDPGAGYDQLWPLPEDLSYSNSTYLTAGWGGYPLGDLNWYPDQLADWEANQRDEDWVTINNMLESGMPTSVEDPVSGVPSGFDLRQNYPNPFNPTTKISFSIPNAENVSLKVYNVLGQQVATLFEGRKQAGVHELTFDASGLTSGVYFYRLESQDAGVSITRKLTLIK